MRSVPPIWCVVPPTVNVLQGGTLSSGPGDTVNDPYPTQSDPYESLVTVQVTVFAPDVVALATAQQSRASSAGTVPDVSDDERWTSATTGRSVTSEAVGPQGRRCCSPSKHKLRSQWRSVAGTFGWSDSDGPSAGRCRRNRNAESLGLAPLNAVGQRLPDHQAGLWRNSPPAPHFVAVSTTPPAAGVSGRAKEVTESVEGRRIAVAVVHDRRCQVFGLSPVAGGDFVQPVVAPLHHSAPGCRRSSRSVGGMRPVHLAPRSSVPPDCPVRSRPC